MGRGRKKREHSFTSKVSSLGGRGGVPKPGGQGPVLTVESLLVHDGAAAQGLVVLLVAHERVHAQDSCEDMGGNCDSPLPDRRASKA